MLLGLIVATLTASVGCQPARAVLRVEQANINARLHGHLILELTNDELMLNKCAVLCKQWTSCKSVNYGRAHRTCQLNSATKEEVQPSDFQANNSFIYIDMALWPTRDSDACFTKPCTGHDRCIATGGSYECLSTDCVDPTNYSANGSTLVAGSNAFNSVRKYVCPAGQFTQGTNTITCSFAGWSTPSFTCEYVRSCSDLQTCDPSYGDDEYWLYPAPYGTTRTKVYCDGMSGSTPKEYISVNPESNYGTRIDYNNITSTRQFSKIRVDIETMTVDPIDKNFSVIDGPPFYVRYGHVTSCIFGSFKIDTRGTGLIVDPTLTWENYGYNTIMKNFTRANGGAVISADCENGCGNCQVVADMTLQLNPNDVVAEEEAVLPVCDN